MKPSEKSAPCPESRSRGKAVHLQTLQSLLNDASALGAGPFFFCRDRDCEVVYFDASGAQVYRRADLSVRVGVKETEEPIPVCYCFGYTRAMLRREGESIAQRIKAEVAAGNCACETKNPQGSCCLGEVNAVVREPAKEGSSWSGGAKLGAFLVALGASACCWLPLLLVAVGVGATGAGAVFESLRPYLTAAAVVLLGGAFLLTYRRRRACGPDGTCAAGPGRRAQVLLWSITAVAAVSFAFPYWSARRLDRANAEAEATSVEPALVVPVKGMTCAACAVAVHDAVRDVSGVVAVRVEQSAGRVHVWTDGSVLPHAVVDAVRDAGYEPGPPTLRATKRTAYIEVKGMIQQLGIT